MIAIEDVAKIISLIRILTKLVFEAPIELPQDSLKFPSYFARITKWGRPRFVNDHHLEFGYFGEMRRSVDYFSPNLKHGKDFYA